MISILVSNQHNYSISSSKIEKALSPFLKEHGVQSDTEVSVAFISEEEMLEISNTYLKDNIIHDVLSFTYSEVKDTFIDIPDGVTRLGEIFVCFPLISEQAKEEGISVEEKVIFLVKHGTLHLMGIHHE